MLAGSREKELRKEEGHREGPPVSFNQQIFIG